MEFRILGPLEVTDGERVIELGARRQRQLLAILVLHANEVVSADRLIDDLWGTEPPATAVKTLQVYVSRLRRTLGHDDVIATRSGGYRLVAAAEAIDAVRFERLTARARTCRSAGDVDGAAADLDEALRLWRGAPLADFAYERFAETAINRLEELRLGALEERIDLDLALGRHRESIGELEVLVGEHPLRERLWSQLMLALYRSGRQAESLEAYRQARSTLVDGLGIEPSSALKELERQILEQDAALAAPPDTQSPPERKPPLKLPATVTPFIGRQHDVEECVGLLRAESVRLLTLTGTGGIGKTRLAREVAATLAGEFRDGVFFVGLARLTDPSLVADTIARALELTEGKAPLEVELKGFLSARELLLLIDNFEQLLPATPVLGELLEAAPGLKLLVTSRTLLHLSGEHQYPVPPLDVPKLDGSLDYEALVPLPAIALFVERARALKPGFALSPTNAAAIGEICRRLDGLPLAIELAAARVRLLGIEALLTRLEQRLPLLTGGASEAPPRQQTVRATIDWSYDLLSESEKVLFARFACFAAGCSFDAVEIVCEATLDEVGSLVDKSLLREREGIDGAVRVEMLAVLREYALERLDLSGDAGAVRRRHLAHYTELAERAEPEILGADQAAWLHRLEAERDNFRAALAWSIGGGCNLDTGLRLIASLRRAWVALGYLTETKRWLNLALARAAPGSTPIRAKALYGLGRVALAQASYDEAVPHLEEAARLSRQLSDTTGLVFALADLASIASAKGEGERAARVANEALTEAREANDEIAIGSALQSLGTALLDRGDLVGARECLQESLMIRRRRGDTRNLANSLVSLGTIACLEGDNERAHDLLNESLAYGRELGNVPLVATALSNLALVSLIEGDHTRAATLAREALLLSRRIGDKWTTGECLHVYAGLAAAHGEREHAALLAGAADGLHESLHSPPSRVERVVHDRIAAALEAEPDQAAVRLARTQGRSLTTEEAIASAIQASPPPPTADDLLGERIPLGE
jgi:predicted ATPase/DNA-binding SARP family transcriptional activator